MALGEVEGHGHDEHAEEEHGHDDHADEAAHEEADSDHHEMAEAESDHEHEGEHHDEASHDHEGADKHADHELSDARVDFHLWLDPMNAIAMTEAIVVALNEVDPDNAATYEANGAVLAEDLIVLDQEIDGRLEPIHDRPFVVFHDAYQYFEDRYGLDAAGSIMVSPEHPPGARRLEQIQHKLEETDAVCVFSEPQFQPALVETVVTGTSAKTAVLDPLGAELEPGPELYPVLLSNLADSLVDCLTALRS